MNEMVLSKVMREQAAVLSGHAALLNELAKSILDKTNNQPLVIVEPTEPTEREPRFEYSSKGASRRLGVSVVTFHDWKRRKLFSYTQVGRKCIYDLPLIMKELKELRNKKSR